MLRHIYPVALLHASNGLWLLLLLDHFCLSVATTTSVALQRSSYRMSALEASRRGKKAGTVRKTAFFGTLSVGIPKQDFNVVFDSGSGNLLIPSSECTSEACIAHTAYFANKSSTAQRVFCDTQGEHPVGKKPSDQITITFGTGEVWGKCMQDQICLGSNCAVGSFIAATYESVSPFLSFHFDGVLGLSLLAMSQGPDFNMMARLHKGNSLRQTLYSVYMSNSDEDESEITFGRIKTEHLASELLWVPTNPDSGYWEVQIADIAVNNEPQNLCTGCKVAVDTGTSELAGPTDILLSLAQSLNAQPDCSNFDTLPRLGFIVSGHILNLDPEDYIDQSGGECQLALMPLDVPPPNGPLFIFGIPFLQKFYTVYDFSQKKVGFGVAKHADMRSGQAQNAMVQVSGALVQDARKSTSGRPDSAMSFLARGAGSKDSSVTPTPS